MNARRALYVQAIRGPVLLVTVGVLFAIHQAGLLSFGRTWPLFIIVIGVMKLLERAWAPPVPAQGPGAYSQTPYGQTGNYGPQNTGFQGYRTSTPPPPPPQNPAAPTSGPGGH
jgi:hypothetical protein